MPTFNFNCADCGQAWSFKRRRAGPNYCKSCIEKRRREGKGPIQMARNYQTLESLEEADLIQSASGRINSEEVPNKIHHESKSVYLSQLRYLLETVIAKGINNDNYPTRVLDDQLPSVTCGSQQFEEMPPRAWFEKCPVCKRGPLIKGSGRRRLGLAQVDTFTCNLCEAIFTQKGRRIELSLADPSEEVWKLYQKQSLEEEEWKEISNGGVSNSKHDELVKRNLRKQQEETVHADRVAIHNWLLDLREGRVSYDAGGNKEILLKNGESLVFALPDISLMEPRSVRHAIYGGPSFRLAKGVSFRVGVSRSESHDELRTVDTGTFTLTDKRLVFSGAKRTVAVNLGSLVSVEAYADGIGIHRDGRQRAQYLVNTDRWSVQIGGQATREEASLTGETIKWLIEGLVSRL